MAAEYDDRDLFARLFEEEALTPQLIYDQVTDLIAVIKGGGSR